MLTHIYDAIEVTWGQLVNNITCKIFRYQTGPLFTKRVVVLLLDLVKSRNRETRL